MISLPVRNHMLLAHIHTSTKIPHAGQTENAMSICAGEHEAEGDFRGAA